MPLCVIEGAITATIAATAFTLSWTHSVEKTEWREHWVLEQHRLRVVEARVRGSGAGMEPPEGSVLQDGWWVYRPAIPPQEKLVLARSGATGGGWQLCVEEDCREIGGTSAGSPVVIRACGGE
ncbi:DUF1850 domain-containing protein [Mesorhizobium sp. Z1-4]|uniref:DUF1850 domain-containing protein n=1 Tax=Mesorhizobium sp. Z1-4 TaxID=2448478 RepID=UPI000FD8C204|nr:DUF1850 domain-containing protein [Mesorhizobium sp. Z1-4]